MTKTRTIDAAGRKLGRVAAEAANALRGKDTPAFRPNALPDLNVVIENAGKLDISEKKMGEKEYRRYSGYPGGQKTETLAEVAAKKGLSEALRRAVSGMLPKNKLRASALKRLAVTE